MASNPSNVKEDYGGDGTSGMNLSERHTPHRTHAQLRKDGFHYFKLDTAPQSVWSLGGVDLGRRAMLSFNAATKAGTYHATVLPGAQLPAGTFNTDLEVFVLSGAIQIGDWVLKKHGYMFVPAGVHLGAMELIGPALGQAGAELVWMENGGATGNAEFAHATGDGHTEAGEARLSEFVAPLDSSYLGWSSCSTAQFEVSKKKWLRRAKNGGGVWLRHLLPHYQGDGAMLQSYTEECLGIDGAVDVGGGRFGVGDFCHVAHHTKVPIHSGAGSCTCLVRIDRDLTQPGAVITHRELPPPRPVDWSAGELGAAPASLPGPTLGIVPHGFLKHVGTWEGTYTHIGCDGKVTDVHDCKIEIGIHGDLHSQRNTYTWRDEPGGEPTKTESFLFPGRFDRDGVAWIEADKISGWGRALDADGTVLFYGGFKPATMTADSKVTVDTFDLIRIVNVDGAADHRYRTWQVKAGDELMKIVHVEERRTSSENNFWIPRSDAVQRLYASEQHERAEQDRLPAFFA
jgi:hypothetical protein